MITENLNNITYEEFIKDLKVYPSYKEAQKEGFEAHHIIPISIQKSNGILKDSNDFDDRCFRLTTFEHTFIHYLLAKKYGGEYSRLFLCFINYNEKKLSDIEKITLKDLEDYSHLREKGILEISKSLKGHYISDETRQLWSQQRKGKKRSIILTEDQRKRISDSKKGEKNGMYGKKRTEKAKKLTSEKLMGHEVSKETREKISKNNSMYNEDVIKKHRDTIKRLSEDYKSDKESGLWTNTFREYQKWWSKNKK